MFDAGFWEIALIAIIVLIVVGPEKMPELARTAGKYIAKVKRFIAQVNTDINNEIDSTDIKKHLELEDENANIIDIVKDTETQIKEKLKDE